MELAVFSSDTMRCDVEAEEIERVRLADRTHAEEIPVALRDWTKTPYG